MLFFTYLLLTWANAWFAGENLEHKNYPLAALNIIAVILGVKGMWGLM